MNPPTKVEPDLAPSHSPTHGWISPLVHRSLIILTWPSTRIIGRPHLPEGLSDVDHRRHSAVRAWRVDTYLLACLLLGIVCFVLLTVGRNSSAMSWLLIYPIWRIVDSIAAVIRIALFDDLKTAHGKLVRRSSPRGILLGVVNYLELVVSFAAIYGHFPEHVRVLYETSTTTADHLLQAMHMSFATQFTIGFGDVVPLGWLRPVTWLQGTSGLLIMGVLIARYVSRTS